MMSLSRYYTTLVLLIVSFVAFAQQEEEQEANQMNQEVKVVKPYEPTISDAFKISELPKINDTIKVTPEFEYSINPVKMDAGFEPTQIKPARLIKEPLSKLFHVYLKAGYGSYFTPLGEIYLGSIRSDKWKWGGTLLHKSSEGKVKNSAGQKVFAGYSNTKSDWHVQRFISDEKTFRADFNYSRNKNYYYGFNPQLALENNIPAPLKKVDMDHQLVNTVGGKLQLKTNYIDSSHVNYDIQLKYRMLNAIQDVSENQFLLKGEIDYFFEQEFIGMDLSLNNLSNSGLVNGVSGAVVEFSPWVGAFGNKWRVIAGVNTTYDQRKEDYSFFPRLSMHYNIIDYFLIPYFELDGVYSVNSYEDILWENPYVNPTLSVEPTQEKINLNFGFRGNISSKVAFNLKVNYTDIKQQYLYVNDTSLGLQNQFNVVYDDMVRMRFLGEISYKTGQNLFLALKGNYYHYELSNELHAWHKPNYEFSLEARYLMKDKLIATMNIFALGKRYAREFDAADELVAKELSGVVDLNLGLEYRLSKKMSAFINLNNIAATKYYKWNNYPTQKFNAMLGVTYAF